MGLRPKIPKSRMPGGISVIFPLYDYKCKTFQFCDAGVVLFGLRSGFVNFRGCAENPEISHAGGNFCNFATL